MASASVPVIDISPFFHGSTEKRLEVARKIGDACRDVGFFVITGHGIDQHIIDNVCKFNINLLCSSIFFYM